MSFDEKSALSAAKLMRGLTDEQREEAIAASDNVIGFARMTARRKQVLMQKSYRAPRKPGNGPRTA